MRKKPNTFVCDKCGDTFEQTLPFEEAMADAIKIFGALPKEDRAMVCGDCYNEIDLEATAQRYAEDRKAERN